MKRLIAFIAGFLATTTLCAQQAEKPKTYHVGDYKVYILHEHQGLANTGILIDAPEDVVARYAPDGTFPNAVNAVLIEKDGEVWLADTGFGRNIFGQKAALGISPESVDHILLTHMHGDHIGGMLREGAPAFPNADVTISTNESGYWGSEEIMMGMPENNRGNFMSAQSVIKAYGDKVRIDEPFTLSEEFEDGISMIEAYGHTPGHVMFLVKDGGNHLLIWGDLTHALAVQMPHPEISVTYDVDPDMARETRLKVLKYVSDNEIPVAGMHIPFSGTGMVKKAQTGYTFTDGDLTNR